MVETMVIIVRAMRFSLLASEAKSNAMGLVESVDT
jgi:hypothetical protein